MRMLLPPDATLKDAATKATTNANADPSPLKGIRDDSIQAPAAWPVVPPNLFS